MGVGTNLKEILRHKKMTIKQLSGLADIPVNTLYSITKRDSERVDKVILNRLASVLGCTVDYLLGNVDEYDVRRSVELDQKLAAVGFSIGWNEDDGTLWINYPDGILEVGNDELVELDNSANAYLRFMLQELRERNQDSFSPKRKRSQLPQSAPESTPPARGIDTTPPTDNLQRLQEDEE